jgi:hypothetical protein
MSRVADRAAAAPGGLSVFDLCLRSCSPAELRTLRDGMASERRQLLEELRAAPAVVRADIERELADAKQQGARLNAVLHTTARLHNTARRPHIRDGLRSGRPRTSRRVRARGPSSDDPDPASDEPASRPAAQREVEAAHRRVLIGARR